MKLRTKYCKYTNKRCSLYLTLGSICLRQFYFNFLLTIQLLRRVCSTYLDKGKYLQLNRRQCAKSFQQRGSIDIVQGFVLPISAWTTNLANASLKRTLPIRSPRLLQRTFPEQRWHHAGPQHQVLSGHARKADALWSLLPLRRHFVRVPADRVLDFAGDQRPRLGADSKLLHPGQNYFLH